MKIVVAPDKFKGSLTAAQACQAITEGIRQVIPAAEVVEIPLADGGEGTVAALVSATRGELREVKVCGPLIDTVSATYGILGDDESRNHRSVKTAVIEMAAAAGLVLIDPSLRNPLQTTTYGVGQLIMDGLDLGCRDFIVGIGGSATNDCGLGMAQALGVKFYDENDHEIRTRLTGDLMGQAASIDSSGIDPRIKECNFMVACDVENPLLGPQGATYVYAPQKGANREMLQILETNMSRIIDLIETDTGRKIRQIPGAGAAGGLGAGLMAFLNGKLSQGIDIVMQYSRFAQRIRGAQLILTGEGRIDESTAFGKTISGIALMAQHQSIPVIALTGMISGEIEQLYNIGITAIMPICPGPLSLKESMKTAGQLLTRATEQTLKLAQINL